MRYKADRIEALNTQYQALLNLIDNSKHRGELKPLVPGMLHLADIATSNRFRGGKADTIAKDYQRRLVELVGLNFGQDAIDSLGLSIPKTLLRCSGGKYREAQRMFREARSMRAFKAKRDNGKVNPMTLAKEAQTHRNNRTCYTPQTDGLIVKRSASSKTLTRFDVEALRDYQ